MKKLIITTVFMLAGCSASLSDYQGQQPPFDLAEYFSSPVAAYGIVQDHRTRLTRHFCVEIVPQWQAGEGTLHETFFFSDGEQQVRIWQLQTSGLLVTGSAADVVGQASGEARGNAFNFRYVLDVPVGEQRYTLSVDDWMFRLDTDRVMNRSYLKKFGITVAEVSIFFDRSAPARCTG